MFDSSISHMILGLGSPRDEGVVGWGMGVLLTDFQGRDGNLSVLYLIWITICYSVTVVLNLFLGP